MSTIKPRDLKTDQNSDKYMIPGNGTRKKVMVWSGKSRGYQYAQVFLRDLLTGKKIWSHQMFICTVSTFLFHVKAKWWYRFATGRMGRWKGWHAWTALNTRPHSLLLRDTGHFLEQVPCICVPGQQDNSWPLALDSSPRRTSFYRALTAGRPKNQKNPTQIGTVPFNVHNAGHCSLHMMMTAAAVGSVHAHEWK